MRQSLNSLAAQNSMAQYQQQSQQVQSTLYRPSRYSSHSVNQPPTNYRGSTQMNQQLDNQTGLSQGLYHGDVQYPSQRIVPQHTPQSVPQSYYTSQGTSASSKGPSWGRPQSSPQEQQYIHGQQNPPLGRGRGGGPGFSS